MGAGNSDSDEEVAAVGVAAPEDIEGRISNIPPQLPPVPKRPPLPRTPLPVRRPPPPPPRGKKRPAPPRPAPPPPKRRPKAPAPPPAPDSNSRDSGIDFDRIVAAPAPLASAPETLELPAPASAPAEEKRGIGAGTIAIALLAGAGIVAAAILLPGDPDPEPVGEPEQQATPLRPLPSPDTGALVDAGAPDVQEVAAVTMEPEREAVSPMVERSSPMGSGMGMQATVMTTQMTGQTDEERLSQEWAASAMEASPMEASPMEATMAAQMEPEPEVDLPERPSRDQVQSALAAVRPAVGACLNGGHGRIPVRITIVGSGRVTTAVVQDRYFARPPTGSCIARAVRTARFPRFSDDRLVVLYPFQL